MQIVPNPSSGVFVVRFAKVDGPGLLTVEDLSGHRVFETNFIPTQLAYPIDLAAAAKGVYMVRATSASGLIATQKIVLE
jgi:hypothetical protein